jgi:acyl-CoA thioester hydrolase
MAPTDRYVSETTFNVRYAETDMMGIVHHASYLVWFEEGRSAFIREQGGSYASIEESGYFLAAGELTARYIKAAIYDQQVTVKCWIDSYKSRTITFACEVVGTEYSDLLFKSSLKLICLDKGGHQITRIPKDDWSQWLD